MLQTVHKCDICQKDAKIYKLESQEYSIDLCDAHAVEILKKFMKSDSGYLFAGFAEELKYYAKPY